MPGRQDEIYSGSLDDCKVLTSRPLINDDVFVIVVGEKEDIRDVARLSEVPVDGLLGRILISIEMRDDDDQG